MLKPEDVAFVEKNLDELNKDALRIYTNSVVTVDNVEEIKGKRAVVVEDGPTLTHGHMAYGAGYIAVKEHGVIIVDPKPHVVGTMKKVFEEFSQIQEIVPGNGLQ